MLVKQAKAPKLNLTGARKEKAKALGLMGVGVATLVGLSALVLNFKQSEIDVIRIKKTLSQGDIVTEEYMEPLRMLKSTYTQQGLVQYTDKDGNVKSEQILIPWEQRAEYEGKIISNFIRSGNMLTKLDVTSEVIQANPWLKDMKPDEESYQMPFDPKAVNTQMLYPGTSLRGRVVVSVPNDKLKDVQCKIETANSAALRNNGKGVVDSIMIEDDLGMEGDSFSGAATTVTGKTPVAQIVIPRMTIADMRNADGESIFNLYMSLLKMSIVEREKYLSTNISNNETAIEFQKRVTPVSVTFIVDSASANKLAEFEELSKMGAASIKYTILSTVEPDNLMLQFAELANQFNTVTPKWGD